ncbi:MAG: cyclic nucleotide-binding domain-containing protein [Ignavibacteria bacterium]|nr:cyclic nucleotide-binding domain-containing protein [Ignavibacteria bacterium]
MAAEKNILAVKSSLWHNIFKASGNQQKIFQLLKGFPGFANLKNREVKDIQKLVQVREFLKNEVIFFQGDPGFSMFIIDSGKVDITCEFKNGSKQNLATLYPGDFFGEMNVILEGKRTATATAIENVKVLVIFRPDLSDLIEKDHSVGYKILNGFSKIFVEKLRNLNSDYLGVLEILSEEKQTQ